jgi:hypothetical protein
VTVLLRVPGGGFAPEGAQVAVGRQPTYIVAADFNGDGRPDLATSDSGADTVTVLLRNASNDGFTQEAGSPITVGPTPIGLAAADFDRDGRTDLAVAVNGQNTVRILRRNAGAGFTVDPPITISGGPQALAAADFDGDQRPDLAVTQVVTNTFVVLRNPAPVQPPPPPPPPPTATPTPVATPVPTPVAGVRVNAIPKSGTVKVKLPGTKRYVDLDKLTSIPVGSTVDARKGKVTIEAAGGSKADFFDGQFKLSQSKGKKPLTTLTLNEPLACPKVKLHAKAAAKKKTRKLWGSGKGTFRTTGRLSSATVRGTKWLVTDRCTTTTTKVTQGSVRVRDFVKRKNVVVRAKHSYVARSRR